MSGPFRSRSGPLTREMLLRPADFGLGTLPDRLAPDAVVKTVCGYCSTGCGLTVHLKDGVAVNLTPTADHPVNRGVACPKGWEALTPMQSGARGTTPLLRDARGRRARIAWPAAFELFTHRFKEIQDEHGKASVAFLGTGQTTCEEMAFLGALAKHGMGMVHGDGNTRQCMASAVSAYKRAFGFDAPPYSYDDLEQSDVIVLIGSNVCIAHPILWERICRNKHKPAIVVIDPRKTETAMMATQHLAPTPGSDLSLLYGLASELIERGAIDPSFIGEHTSGFANFASFVADYRPARAARDTGLAPGELQQLADTIAAGKRVSLWWTMGVNQSHQGVATAQAIINIALMTGSLGRPGTGANSITGQCNAMGSRLFSNTSSLFCGRDFASAEDRADVASILGIAAAEIPSEPSRSYDKIMEGIAAGDIRGLWIVATNTAHSWINQRDARELLARLDYLVVQDIYPDTETAQVADLYLPAAGWGEKEGTFINSERRISVVRNVHQAPGEALSDFNIFRGLAHYWGCDDMFAKWTTPEAVFGILRALSRGTPCDISGIDGYAALSAAGGIQWPCAENAERSSRRLFRDGRRLFRDGRRLFRDGRRLFRDSRRLFRDGQFFHDDKRARFLFARPRPVAEGTNASYPLTLLTGRGSASQWHTQTRTNRSEVLKNLHPGRAYAQLHPGDARQLGVGPTDMIGVRSRRGDVRVRAVITRTVPQGTVFMPMHYAETNELTFGAFDPISRQPAYKACAVQVRPLQRWEES